MSTITRKQAESVLAKLVERYRWDIEGGTIPADGDEPEFVIAPCADVDRPTLHRDEKGFWEIVWESGPSEWAYRFTMGGIDPETAPVVRAYGGTPKAEEPAQVSSKVFLEPVNTYTVGIYEP